MREISNHLDNPSDHDLTITAVDDLNLSADGASYEYRLGFGGGVAYVVFQRGPVKEHGRNGVTETQLLAVLIDRYRAFEAGPLASPYNERTLAALEQALAAQHQRTRDREARRVEGRSEK